MARNGGNYEVSTKLYIGNLPETCKKSELLGLFEQFGTVAECDIVKNYAFVHFDSPDDAQSAAAALDETEFQGSNIKVELSRSKVRTKPGMGNMNECYRCGKEGHWSKDCPKFPGRSSSSRGRGRGRDRDDYPPPPPYPYRRDPYPDPYYDYYRSRYPPPPDRYRPYDPYDRRRPLPPPVDPYYDRDPYSRPPPDYYRRSPPPRDPYYDYYSRRYPPPGPERAGKASDSAYKPY